nr:jacalin-related lectin 3-like [Ipomoea trifida]
MPQCSHGIEWDDINLGQVMGIKIYYDSSGIYSLTFIYVDDNVFRVSSHGNNGFENSQTPSESDPSLPIIPIINYEEFNFQTLEGTQSHAADDPMNNDIHSGPSNEQDNGTFSHIDLMQDDSHIHEGNQSVEPTGSNTDEPVDNIDSSNNIILDYPTEFLTGVNGYRTISYVVKCITFVTNKATHGPFGNQSLGQYDRTFGCNQGGKDNR